jgi:ribosomal protein L11 methyltransferase
MKLHRHQPSSRQNKSPSPYQELFIYYVKGRLKAPGRTFQNNFIGNWQEQDDSILFFSSPAERQIEKLLDCQPHLEYLDSYQMRYEHWLGEKFTTFEHGTFRIKPPWEVGEDSEVDYCAKKQIILDPGLVFGTGSHPTTGDCLAALELAAESTQISSALDLGTGTGLLALAAARLGSNRTLGVDLNLLAAKTARKNVLLNRMEDRIAVIQGRAEDIIAYPADLLIANLHYEVMHRLIDTQGFLAKERFILSGLMGSEAKQLADTLQRCPVEIIKQWTREGVWHTIYGKVEQKGSLSTSTLLGKT